MSTVYVCSVVWVSLARMFLEFAEVFGSRGWVFVISLFKRSIFGFILLSYGVLMYEDELKSEEFEESVAARWLFSTYPVLLWRTKLYDGLYLIKKTSLFEFSGIVTEKSKWVILPPPPPQY